MDHLAGQVGSWNAEVHTPLGTTTVSTSSGEDVAALVILASLGEMQKKNARIGGKRRPQDSYM